MKHDRQGFITTFIRLALEGQPIRVYGDGSQLRDFTYVSDAVDAFLAAGVTEGIRQSLQRRRAGAGAADRGRQPLPEDRGRGGSGRDGPVAPERKKIDIGSIYVDHARLSELTGWEPSVGLADGLDETIGFYQHHGEHYWT